MAEKHFYEQIQHTKTYLIPYFQKHLSGFNNFYILEIGCAEGGFLNVLHESGIRSAGLELAPQRIELAKGKNPDLKIFQGDITDDRIAEQIRATFDLIVMRDTIEHIPHRMAVFTNIKKLLKKNGYLYITFPPKYSGFSGHQQNGSSVLRFLPYLQLLPQCVIKLLGTIFNERSIIVKNVSLNYKQGLSIYAFEKYYSRFGFKPVVKELFLLRPIYKIRYKIPARKVPNIPVLREIIAFGCEYLLKNDWE